MVSSQVIVPRKQRTRQHIIADLSVHYMQGFILEEGHTSQPLGSDYGYDLIHWTFTEDGHPETGSIYFQFKAMERLEKSGADFVYSLDVRDVNLWLWEKTPVILVLFDATLRRAYWMCIQSYFRSEGARHARKGRKSVRVRVPSRQRVNRQAIRKIRDLKQKTQSGMMGVQ